MSLEISEHIDVSAARAEFAAHGWVSLDGFVETSRAHALHEEIAARTDWTEVFSASGNTYEMSMSDYDMLEPERKRELVRLTHRAALDTLQFRYRTVRISEDRSERLARGDLIDSFAEIMNQESSLAMLRQVTGLPEIEFADAQATCYRAGDFLTSHDDAVEGKNRLAAYVYSLTPSWSFDWGGLLLIEDAGRISGYVPAFNSLRIFRIPVSHCVSQVAPWVTESRYSITGWLRSSR